MALNAPNDITKAKRQRACLEYLTYALLLIKCPKAQKVMNLWFDLLKALFTSLLLSNKSRLSAKPSYYRVMWLTV